MTAPLFNGFMTILILAVFGWIISYRPKRGADICSFDIVTILVLAGRKSGKNER
jgi:hypothetical protein